MSRRRTVRDSMGEVCIPDGALYGAQTQRALENFTISQRRFPRGFIRALGLIKASAATTNSALGLLDGKTAQAIYDASMEVAEGLHDIHFPLDVYQTGSGTSTNMNANEVIASRASELLGHPVHPNDHVNMSQSSNDVIPTAIHVSAALACSGVTLPGLMRLGAAIRERASGLKGITKTGRTHLMDAMPVTLAQELGAWATQVEEGRRRIAGGMKSILVLAIGGTAVGSGINAPAGFARGVTRALAGHTGMGFKEARDHFAAQAGVDAATELSAQLKVTASAVIKISNDLRWMNSGPIAGIGEITLPALQPGSSIMPGKINPVIPEAAIMACAQVIANDMAVTMAGAMGNFQLNVMLPLVAVNLLESLELLGNSCLALAEKAIAGFAVNEARINELSGRNPILVTALNAVVGYDKGAEIAKKAYAEGRSVLDVAHELTGLDRGRLGRLLDPSKLTRGGVPR